MSHDDFSELKPSNAKAFFDQGKKIKIGAGKPKFSVGDYILNTKFKVISKVIDVRGIFENEDRTYNYDSAEYVLQDIKNDARDKFMSVVDRANGSLNAAMSHNVKRQYRRRKFAQKIDPYYNKISEEAVRALYMSKVTNGDNDGES